MLRSLLMVAAGAGLYGFAVGSAHSWLYALRNLVKFPMIIVGTGLVCGLAYTLVGRALVPGLAPRRVADLVATLFRDLSILLASLAPPTFLVGYALAVTDDARVGGYGMFLGLNVTFIAGCGVLALLRQTGRLLLESGTHRGRARLVIASWLALTLLIGGQFAWYLRPVFGLPASRGGSPPFALGATPDVRGATNFYEGVWQIVSDPPLPESWR